MSQLVRLEGKHSTQNAHCLVQWGLRQSCVNIQAVFDQTTMIYVTTVGEEGAQ